MRKDLKIGLIAALLPCLVFGNAVYQVYLGNVEHTVEFKVFETYYHEGKSGTQILTFGEGKFFFLGTWTGQFYEDHSYRVTYVRQSGALSKHSLIVIDWEEVT